MNMREVSQKQNSSSSSSSWSLFRHSSLSTAVIALLIPITGFLVFGFSSTLFTVIACILSTALVFISLKQKPASKEDKPQVDALSLRRNNSQEMQGVNMKLQLHHEGATQENDVVKEGGERQIHDFPIRSTELIWKSKDDDRLSTSEDSEVEWSRSDDLGQIPECSDDSISDDDSLIEIALPEGNYIGSIEESKLKQPPSFSEILPESIFRQEGLMDLLAEINEMNEEDNLIEIDISMGSIKCSRFEIEA